MLAKLLALCAIIGLLGCSFMLFMLIGELARRGFISSGSGVWDLRTTVAAFVILLILILGLVPGATL